MFWDDVQRKKKKAEEPEPGYREEFTAFQKDWENLLDDVLLGISEEEIEKKYPNLSSQYSSSELEEKYAYKPKFLDEFIGQKNTIEDLQVQANSSIMKSAIRPCRFLWPPGPWENNTCKNHRQ